MAMQTCQEEAKVVVDHYDPDQLLIDDDEVITSLTPSRKLGGGDTVGTRVMIGNSSGSRTITAAASGDNGGNGDMSSVSSSDSEEEEDSIDALTAKALSREVSEMKERDKRRAEEQEQEMSTTDEEDDDSGDLDSGSTVHQTAAAVVAPAAATAANGFLPRQEKPPSVPPPLLSTSVINTPPPSASSSSSSRPFSKAVKADRFTEGYLVWARIKGYSFWPGIVTVDPVECVTVKHSEPNLLSSKSVVTSKIHVHFLGYANQRAWVPESGIVEYKGTKQYEQMRDQAGGKCKKNDFIPAKKFQTLFDKAAKEAETVFDLPYRKRLEQLNLVYVLVDTPKEEEQPIGAVQQEKTIRRAHSPDKKIFPGKRKKSVSSSGGDTEANGTKSKLSPPAKKRRKSNSIVKKETVVPAISSLTETDLAGEPPIVKAEVKIEGKSSDEGFVETPSSASLASSKPSTSTGSSTPSPTVKKKAPSVAKKRVKKSNPNSPASSLPQKLLQRTPSPIRPRPLPLPTVHVQSPAHIDEIRDINVRREPDDLDTSEDDEDEEGAAQSESPKLGSLIWGRLPGFPYWPCFVTRNPENEYKRDFGKGGKRSEFHVQFFNWNDESGWVTKTLPWCSLVEYKILASKIPRSRLSEYKAWNPPGKQMLQKWNEAYLVAHSTVPMTRRQRHDKHVVFYRKGKEPHASWLLNNLKPQHAGIKVFRREVAENPATTTFLTAAAHTPPPSADSNSPDSGQSGSSPASSPQSHKKKKAVSAQRRTVKRCGRCSACKREDCNKCVPCKNMLKYGGTGSMKNMCCLKRRCTTKGYSKSWTTDQDLVEVSSAGKKKTVAAAGPPSSETVGILSEGRKKSALDKSLISKKPSCLTSPKKNENKSRTNPFKKGKSTKAKERDKVDMTSRGAHDRFLAQISSLDLPPGWVIDANREFQSPDGLSFGSFEDAVKHLFQQNVVGSAVRKRSLSFSGERGEEDDPNPSLLMPSSADRLDQGWLIHRSDRIRYSEEEQTTDVAGQLESRITYFRDHSLARGWTVKKISAKKVWMSKTAFDDKDKFLFIAPENPCFDSKVEVANYIEPKGHPALELEQLMSMSVLREKSPFLILAREKRDQSMLTIKLKDCVEDYANHPILGKAVIPCYVDMVKLPDIFLEHPNVYVRENANEMVITDVNTEEFIAKKIMYE